MRDDMLDALDVAEELDRLVEHDLNRHIDDANETIEQFVREVVEDGTFLPECNVKATLRLTPVERITGRREQDLTAMLSIGMMLGAALERDVPKDTFLEDRWRDGEFTFPEDDGTGDDQ